MNAILQEAQANLAKAATVEIRPLSHTRCRTRIPTLREEKIAFSAASNAAVSSAKKRRRFDATASEIEGLLLDTPELQHYQSQWREIKSRHSAVKARLEGLQSELRKVSSSGREGHLRTALEKYRDEETTLQSQLDDLTAQINSIAEEDHAVSGEMKSLKTRESQRRSAADKLGKLHDKLKEEETEKENIEAEKQRIADELAKLAPPSEQRSTIVQMRRAAEELEKEVAKLEEKQQTTEEGIEEGKRRAVQQGESEEVTQMRQMLAALEQKKTIQGVFDKELRESMTRVVAVLKQRQQPLGVVVDLLLSNGGQMAFETLKTEAAKFVPEQGKNAVIEAVYTLVAAKTLSIDRSSMQQTVSLLV